jgi:PIN domain nuclease of toxin-antitoxin system
MKLLLDTHVLLWALTDEKALHPKAVRAIVNPRNHIYVSAVSAWEIALKKSLGKLKNIPDTLEAALVASQFTVLPITMAHAWRTGEVQALHGDPFDRMLVAQALCENLTLVTRDARMRGYAVPLLEA